jgi:hypothetical protein
MAVITRSPEVILEVCESPSMERRAESSERNNVNCLLRAAGQFFTRKFKA